MIAGSWARCEWARGWPIDESEPSARGEPPNLGRRQPGVSGVGPHVVVVEAPTLEHMSGVGGFAKISSFSSSSRSRPIKLSTKAFCCGLPGMM